MAYDFTAANNDVINFGDLYEDHNVSFSFWLLVKPEGASNTGYIFGKWLSNTGWYCRRDPGVTTRWQFGINASGGVNWAQTSSGTLVQDGWQSVCGTFLDSGADGSCEIYLYQDGGNSGLSNTTADRVDANTNNLAIGNRGDQAVDFEGSIAEVGLWVGYVLTDQDRKILDATRDPLAINRKPTFYAPLQINGRDIIGNNQPTSLSALLRGPHPVSHGRRQVIPMRRQKPGDSVEAVEAAASAITITSVGGDDVFNSGEQNVVMLGSGFAHV